MSKALVPKSAPDEWDQLVPLWLHGRPESTQEIYKPVIKDFMQSVNRKPISQVTLKDLQDYADRFRAQKPRTIERKLATVKSLLAFSHKTGMIPFDVGRALRMPKIPDDLAEKILPEADIQHMIRMEPDMRNQVLLRILYGTAIRASEAAGLCWKDVQPRGENGQISVLGKGHKIRAIRLSSSVWQALVSIRPKDATLNTRVFVCSKGRPLHRTTISNIVRKAAHRANIPLKVSAHWMRHGHASHAVDKGAPLSLISQTLGHSNLVTTSRYIHVRPDESSSRYLDA